MTKREIFQKFCHELQMLHSLQRKLKISGGVLKQADDPHPYKANKREIMRIEEDMRVLRTFTTKLLGRTWTTVIYLYDNEARNQLIEANK